MLNLRLKLLVTMLAAVFAIKTAININLIKNHTHVSNAGKLDASNFTAFFRAKISYNIFSSRFCCKFNIFVYVNVIMHGLKITIKN